MAVVGGGVLGGTVALRLREAGHEVVLFESEDRLGGLASAWEIGDVTWDRHYHVTLGSDSHTRALLELVGLDDEIRWVTTSTGTFIDGEMHDMSNVIDYVRFPALGIGDKARLAWTILYAARTRRWERLETVPVVDWLVKHSGRRAFERFWKPLLEAKLGDATQQTSAAFIWATAQRLYAARKTGMKTELFGYVPGGYDRILSSLEKALAGAGVELRLEAPVEEVGSGPTVTARGQTESFDRVIVTTPLPVVARLVHGLGSPERERLVGTDYQGVVCMSVLTRQSLSPYYLTYLYDPAPFTAIVEMSAFVDPVEFGGRTLLYLPKYASPGDPIFEESDASIESRFLSALAEIHPDFDPSDVEAVRISRAPMVFPISTLGRSRTVPSFDTSVEGVHVVSSGQIVNGTLNVNDTLRLAARGLAHIGTLEAGGPT